ncbi:hypothetical protein GGR54DRAFT_637367 [Hypoxylon sp. NC1633]|nr:hypothetical protein GGR54DRAFT_637367 [Hypoxylon sp. NC1633]
MNDPSLSPSWTPAILTACCLGSVGTVVFSQFFNTATAYQAAPHEIVSFFDAVDFSIEENESYDRDVAKVQRLEDKMRLNRLLREIQKNGDELREELGRLVISEDNRTLRLSARFNWAVHRRHLEEKMRRLDMLRLRFLTVYAGIVATIAGDRMKHAEKITPKDPEKAALHRPASMPKSVTDSIKHRPPLRRITAPTGATTMGRHQTPETPHRIGWMGVVQELQRSPLMHKRRTSIDMAMGMRSPPPMSPLGSPLSLTPEMNNERFHDAVHIIPEHEI